MKHKRHSEEQIIAILKEHPVPDRRDHVRRCPRRTRHTRCDGSECSRSADRARDEEYAAREASRRP